MTRDEARQLLDGGAELDGLVLTGQGVIIARGKIRKTGTILIAADMGTATALQLKHAGSTLDVPLFVPVPLRKGMELQIEFGANWQGKKRRG